MDCREPDEGSDDEKPDLMVEDVTKPKCAYRPRSFLQSFYKPCEKYIR